MPPGPSQTRRTSTGAGGEGQPQLLAKCMTTPVGSMEPGYRWHWGPLGPKPRSAEHLESPRTGPRHRVPRGGWGHRLSTAPARPRGRCSRRLLGSQDGCWAPDEGWGWRGRLSLRGPAGLWPHRAAVPMDSLLWEELLGFPMYLRRGFRFLSSKASLSFLELLLC